MDRQSLSEQFIPCKELVRQVEKAKSEFDCVSEIHEANPSTFCEEDYLIITSCDEYNYGANGDGPAIAKKIVARYEYIKSANTESQHPESYFEWAQKAYKALLDSKENTEGSEC